MGQDNTLRHSHDAIDFSKLIHKDYIKKSKSESIYIY